MTDMTISGPRAAFAERARPPAEELKQANRFLETVAALQKQGAAPPREDLTRGEDLLKTLSARAELFAYEAAIGIGFTAVSENDIERQVRALSEKAEEIQLTTDRLRQTLRQLAG